MKKHIPLRVPLRAFAGGVGLLTTLGVALSAASAKTTPHFRVSAAQATAIVLKRFPGQLTGKPSLEDEEGSWQYGVMVRSGRTLREVMVDAKTGKIVNVEVTTSGKEKSEAKTDAADEAKAAKARAAKSAHATQNKATPNKATTKK